MQNTQIWFHPRRALCHCHRTRPLTQNLRPQLTSLPWTLGSSAIRWLKSIENADGGFGEVLDTYRDPTLAHRRAELDELERSSIEEMLATDKEQRTEVGSALESFLVGSQQVSNPCACSHIPSLDGAKADSKAEENNESCWIGIFLYALFFHIKSRLFLHNLLTLL